MLNLRVAKRSDPIRVSELAEFVYCKRAWWLKMVQKQPSSAESRKGTVVAFALLLVGDAARVKGMPRARKVTYKNGDGED